MNSTKNCPIMLLKVNNKVGDMFYKEMAKHGCHVINHVIWSTPIAVFQVPNLLFVNQHYLLLRNLDFQLILKLS